MKIKKNVWALLLIALFSIQTQAKNALVIVAHGAPNAEWNSPVLNLEKSVKEIIQKRGISDIGYVRVALMEFTKPTVADVIADCEKQNVDRIFVVPIFITASSHSEQDVPNILGLKYNQKTINDLKEEGTTLVKTTTPITIGTPLSNGNVIDEIILDRVKSLNIDSKKDALLLVAHGDADYISWWKQLTKKAGEYVAAQTGVEYAGGAFVGMGQAFVKDLRPHLDAAAKSGKRVVVQGIYLSSGLASMARANGATKNGNVMFSPYGLLPEDSNLRISNWIVDRATEWLKSIN